MAERCVALLRGINVGTAKRVAMADLRALCERLGYREVRTLLNSGNVVFDVGPGADAAKAAGPRLETAIAAELGVDARVLVLKGRDLVAAVEGNPLADAATDPSRMLLLATADAKALARLEPLLGEDWSPEAIALGPGVAYLWCPKGIADSRLGAAAHRLVGRDGTARNLATMTKLAALVGMTLLSLVAGGCAGSRGARPSWMSGEAPRRDHLVVLEKGADVCALLASGETLCGEVITLSADSVAIGVIDSPHPDGRMVARADIVDLETRGGSGVLALVVGSLAVAAAGVLVLAVMFLVNPPSFN